MTTKYVIYIEDAIIGTKLSLDVSDGGILNENCVKWAVEDDLNGPSSTSLIYTTDKAERLGRKSDYIYGFYKANNLVRLHIYGKNGIELEIENVKILDKKGGH